LYLSLLLHL
jgi:hypothetical protein